VPPQTAVRDLLWYFDRLPDQRSFAHVLVIVAAAPYALQSVVQLLVDLTGVHRRSTPSHDFAITFRFSL
jgi:hypothetical protein